MDNFGVGAAEGKAGSARLRKANKRRRFAAEEPFVLSACMTPLSTSPCACLDLQGLLSDA